MLISTLLNLTLAFSLLLSDTTLRAGLTLNVRLRDQHGAAVVHTTVQVYDATQTRRLLSQATTDQDGQAAILNLSAGWVVVALHGTHSAGQRLYQAGSDRHGLRFSIEPGENRLELRVEPDGRVVPDLAMFVRLPPVPVVTTTPIHTPPVVVHLPGARGVEQAPDSGQQRGQLLLALAVGSIALTGVYWYHARRRQP